MGRATITVKEEFDKTIRVAHDAAHDAIKEAVQKGADVAEATLNEYAVARAYEDLNAQMASEATELSGSFYVKSAISEKWGTDPWYLKFFEYGAEQIEAMPFIRPGAKVMKKTFDDYMKMKFDAKIRTRVHIT